MIRHIYIATPDGYSTVEVRVREGRWILTASGDGRAAEALKGGIEDPEATLKAAGFAILSEQDVEALNKAKAEKDAALWAEQAAKAAEQAAVNAAVKAKEDAEIRDWLIKMSAPGVLFRRLGLDVTIEKVAGKK